MEQKWTNHDGYGQCREGAVAEACIARGPSPSGQTVGDGENNTLGDLEWLYAASYGN